MYHFQQAFQSRRELAHSTQQRGVTIALDRRVHEVEQPDYHEWSNDCEQQIRSIREENRRVWEELGLNISFETDSNFSLASSTAGSEDNGGSPPDGSEDSTMSISLTSPQVSRNVVAPPPAVHPAVHPATFPLAKAPHTAETCPEEQDHLGFSAPPHLLISLQARAPDSKYVHCRNCGLEWELPAPPAQRCTRCHREVTNGRISQAHQSLTEEESELYRQVSSHSSLCLPPA